MPLTDLCNRPAGRAPVHRSIPASRTPRGALDAGGGSFDAEPPASGGAPDAPSRTKREGGAPHRSGAALRRRSRPHTALEAQPSDAPCPVRAGKPKRRGPISPYPRQGARRNQPEAPSIDICPCAACASQESVSTSATTTVVQHSHGSTDHPTHRAGSCPPARWMRAALAPLGAGPAKLSPSQGPPQAYALASSSPAIARWGALPRPDRLGHLLSRTRACAGWRSRTQVMRKRGSREYAGGRRAKRRPRQGYGRRPSAKKAVAAHPRCLPSTGSPMGRPSNPQVVPCLWNTGWCLCYRR